MNKEIVQGKIKEIEELLRIIKEELEKPEETPAV